MCTSPDCCIPEDLRFPEKIFEGLYLTPGRQQSKTLILGANVDKKWATNGNQKLFLTIFDPCSSIVKRFFDCGLSGVYLNMNMAAITV